MQYTCNQENRNCLEPKAYHLFEPEVTVEPADPATYEPQKSGYTYGLVVLKGFFKYEND